MDANDFTIALVFHLSTRCNLECVYCNVDAGPHGIRPVLDPAVFEKWIVSFASLGPSALAIQLHGGEPLVVDPPVEVFAAIARNALARFPGTRLVDIAIQSNGLNLDDNRAESLEKAGVRINISIDGPAPVHDRQRPSAPGRGSHRESVQAHHRLRARGNNSAVIAVITDPLDVMPALNFFLEGGFLEARMNPMRPEGRGLRIRDWSDEEFMRRMAVEYFEAAKHIARHNARSPGTPFFEDNLATVMEYLINQSGIPSLHWTFLIDDHGDLWAHPGGYGVETQRLTRGEPPSLASLGRALRVQTDVAAGLSGMRARLFKPCTECKTPDFCVPYCAPQFKGTTLPGCVWRLELTTRLESWLEEEPDAARMLARPNRLTEVQVR